VEAAVAYRLGIAIALGLVIGIERGWKARTEAEGLRSAGIRTFGLVGLLGGIAAVLAQSAGPVVLAASFAGFALVVAATYITTAPRTGDYGATTELALLVTFGLGALTLYGFELEAVGAAVVVAVLLSAKTLLHAWLERVRQPEIEATLQLALVALVVLPLLPDREVSPLGSVNPRTIGLLVLLIMGLSFLSYIAIKLLGARLGIMITAALGGLASSTAVTLTFASRARSERLLVPLLAAGIGVASATMAPRVLVEVAIVQPSLVGLIAPPLVAMALAPLPLAFWLSRRLASREALEVDLRNPLQLSRALWYGALLAAIFFLIGGAQTWLGDAGVLVLSGLSGLIDVDAASLSLAEMAGHGLPASVAARGIVLAALSNTAAKAILACLVGGAVLVRPAGGILMLTLFAGLAVALVSLF
jgi:uncharacterized membrane protein (DUF4010 family)